MNQNTFVANRLREVLLDGTFIAHTNFRAQITQTNWQDAVYQFQNLNTIAALTFHINYYLSGVIDAFKTGRLEISDRYSFDLPPMSSEDDWKNLVNEFLLKAEKLALAIEQLPSNKLDDIFIEAQYGTYLRNIETMIEHSYYHLGQVVLIRKMIKSK